MTIKKTSDKSFGIDFRTNNKQKKKKIKQSNLYKKFNKLHKINKTFDINILILYLICI